MTAHICVVITSGMLTGALPELPRRSVDTLYRPPTGNRISVGAGGDLQAALHAAQPGDVIELQAGATFQGNFVLPKKTGTGTIHIQSSSYATLPNPGKRVSPLDAVHMPRIETPNSVPVFQTENGASGYRFVGLDIGATLQDRSSVVYNLISLGSNATSADQIPTNIVIDRCYLHGNVNANVRRGIALNSAYSGVVDSYLDEFHEEGADSQAIAGWQGPGPFKIVNNYLAAATENIIFGGATPQIAGLVPEDIEIRDNHFFKPLRWKADDPSFDGNDWSIKNSFELKNARRVLVEGNVFENNWADSQVGFAVLLTVRGEDGAAPWSAVQDVTFQYNILRNSDQGLSLHSYDDGGESARTERILVQHNYWDDVGGRLFQLINQERGGADSITIANNTSNRSGDQFIVLGDTTNQRHTNLVVNNNIAPGGQYGIHGSGTGSGTSALDAYADQWMMERNVLSALDPAFYPPNNFYPAALSDIGFVDMSSGDYRLSALSLYRAQGTDGRDPGVDFDTLFVKTIRAVSGTFQCDLNRDSAIDAADAAAMFANWGRAGVGDCNGDGNVDAADAGILFVEWSGDRSSTHAEAVPEPAGGLVLRLCFGLVVLVARRSPVVGAVKKTVTR